MKITLGKTVRFSTCFRCGKKYVKNCNSQKYCKSRKIKGSCGYKSWADNTELSHRKQWGTKKWKEKKAKHRETFRKKHPYYWKENGPRYYRKRKIKNRKGRSAGMGTRREGFGEKVRGRFIRKGFTRSMVD
jgi:hypothetical protein